MNPAQDFKQAIEQARQAQTPAERAEWASKARAIFDQHGDQFPAPLRAKAEQQLSKVAAHMDKPARAKAQIERTTEGTAFRKELRAAMESYDAAEDKTAAEAELKSLFERAKAQQADFSADEWQKIERRMHKFQKRTQR